MQRTLGRFSRGLCVFTILVLMGACSAFGASPTGDRLDRMQASPQYAGEGSFGNTLPMTEDSWGVTELLEIMRDWGTGFGTRTPDEPVPVEVLAADDFAHPATDLTVRWLGHSTLLIEIEGKRILTDPIWSQRASPFQWAGPGRFYPPLVNIDDLLPLDAVVISHDHYDHLDQATVVALKDRVDFYVPLGVGAHLERWGVSSARIHELDWWESADIGGIELVCTPARHFSGRSLTDRNRTLWASWSIIGERRRVYFGGDSGLFPELSEIGDRLGPFDMTMLDTGAYSSRWPDVHMGPEQAVIAHRALRGDVLLPIHWGMFNLAFHHWVEPIERMRALAETEGVRIAQPRPGALVDIRAPLPVDRWWPDATWRTAEEYPVRSSHIDEAWAVRYGHPQTPAVRVGR